MARKSDVLKKLEQVRQRRREIERKVEQKRIEWERARQELANAKRDEKGVSHD